MQASREQWLWSWAAVCLALIYGSAFVARAITDFLRDRNLLRLTVVALAAAAGLVALWWVLHSRPGARESIALAAVAGLYLLLLFFWRSRPEEQIHILEYSALAGLIHAALGERQKRVEAPARLAARSGWSPALMAILATALLGLLDEGIQYLLPERYFDLRDIALNVLAGMLAVLARTVHR